MDTFTIVLQKRWRQLSFLHVYHHTSVFLFYWLNLRRGYDGDIFLTIMLNAAIHTVMYTYYFLTMHTKDPIWWKSSLTIFQMLQFCTMITQGFLLLASGDSAFPPNNTKAYIVYIFTMLFLFMHFFLTGGKKPTGDKKEKDTKQKEKKK